MSRPSKRVREAAVVLAWGDGFPPETFQALPNWRKRIYIEDAQLCLDELDALTTDPARNT